MMAEDAAMQVNDLTAMLLGQMRLLQKAPIILVRHEADFHALLFVGRFQIAMPRHFPRIALGLAAQWKEGAAELVLAQRKQKITLVLPRIAPAFEQSSRPVRAFLQPRKMAGGNVLRPELLRSLDQPAELQILIAHDA